MTDLYSYNFDITKAFSLAATAGGKQYTLTTATLSSSCCADHISIGNVCAACLTAQLEERAYLYDSDLVLTAAFASGSITLGTFRVTECTCNDYGTSITAYDALFWATGAEYIPTVTGTPTVSDVLQDLAQQIGAPLFTPLPALASTTTVNGSLTGYTLRDMLGYMAALVGRNVVLSRSGKIHLVWFSSGMTAEDYYDSGLHVAGAYTLAHISVDVPTISAEEDGTETEETITLHAGSGSGMGFEIRNPFMTQSALDAVWSAIGGGTGYIGTLSMPFGLQCEPGDIVTATTVDGIAVSLLATTVVLSLDGGCKCDITAAGTSQTQQAAGFQGTIGKQLSVMEADLGRFRQVIVQDENGKTMISPGRIDVDELFTRDIYASNTIHGAKIAGESIDISAMRANILYQSPTLGGSDSSSIHKQLTAIDLKSVPYSFISDDGLKYDIIGFDMICRADGDYINSECGFQFLPQNNEIIVKGALRYAGDVAPTAITIADGVTAYSYGGSPISVPSYSVHHGLCYLTGSVSASYEGSQKVLGTIPATCAPATNMVWFAPCAGEHIARLHINPSGAIYLDWVLNISNGANYTSSLWIQLNTVFMPQGAASVLDLDDAQEEEIMIEHIEKGEIE